MLKNQEIQMSWAYASRRQTQSQNYETIFQNCKILLLLLMLLIALLLTIIRKQVLIDRFEF